MYPDLFKNIFVQILRLIAQSIHDLPESPIAACRLPERQPLPIRTRAHPPRTFISEILSYGRITQPQSQQIQRWNEKR